LREIKPIEQLRSLLVKTIVQDLKTLAGDFWGEDSIEDFLAFLKQQRQEIRTVN
jgi:hypothetical protein